MPANSSSTVRCVIGRADVIVTGTRAFSPTLIGSLLAPVSRAATFSPAMLAWQGPSIVASAFGAAVSPAAAASATTSTKTAIRRCMKPPGAASDARV